ncbi:uncharacterized protein BX664DRAFT_358262 [Halteromyces radiatus]|uniref:uncharacterized protein n=1 Tax=Halteromyces radiatus TaxID=101107 RepID=UPI0022207596|nr:uncharacterized protein BX664DRAFT_358262 [Halteromyces radiatus]KAI8093887.1 hypothetical protein BX664DRAFT_358262 [Halteromyces radiatus]
MRFQLVTLFATLIMTTMAVPELEHDPSEFDIHDCQYFQPTSCIRECPKGYLGVYRTGCFAAEDRHECCGVRCCRSRHEDDNEDEGSLATSAVSNNRYAIAARTPKKGVVA